MIPKFDSCLVCDFVRPELRGKLIIIGYYGICPNVDVQVLRPDLPTAVSFMFVGGPGDGNFVASFDIVDDAEQVIASSAEMAFVANAAPTALIPAFLVTFGHTGAFTARAVIDGDVRFRGAFKVSQMY